jgi:hypothetical protein
MKRASTAERIGQLTDEGTADKIYRAASVPVPASQLYTRADGAAVKLSKFIDGAETLQSMRQRLGESSAEYKAVIAEIHKGFHVDAWMANWDVIGTGADNILVAGGVPYRVDNGGALRWRARGDAKVLSDKSVSELWTMRNRPTLTGVVNRDAHSVFGGLGAYRMHRAIKDTDFHALSRLIPDRTLAATMRKRAQHMKRFANRGMHYEYHGIRETFYDDVSHEIAVLDEKGVLDKLPTRLRPNSPSNVVRMTDENGKDWDELRSSDPSTSAYAAWAKEMGSRLLGSDDKIIEIMDWSTRWAQEQAGSSWAKGASMFKRWLTERKFVGAEVEMFDYNGRVAANDWTEITRVGQAAMLNDKQPISPLTRDQTDMLLLSQQALNQAFLERVDMQWSDRTRKCLRLFRTEDKTVLPLILRDPAPVAGGVYQDTLLGANESSSPNWAIGVKGRELTERAVPYCRINMHYALGRPNEWSKSIGGMFAGDSENEVSAAMSGLPAKYHGDLHRLSTSQLQLIHRRADQANAWEAPTDYLMAEEVDVRNANELYELSRP